MAKCYRSTIAVFLLLFASAAWAAEKDVQRYSRRYSNLERKSFLLGPTGIRACGPHGLSRNVLERRGYEIRSDFLVTSIDPGAPAEGLIRPHDVIIGANGNPFLEGGDPRVDLGYAIVDSEAGNGDLRLRIVREGIEQEVTVRIPPIGGYSATWPFDCPRTDQMVEDACRYLAEEQMPDGHVPADEAFVGTVHAGLFWLATGEPKYLENARRAAYWFIDHITEIEERGERVGWGPWFGSYGGILLAEYYEMTGDRGVLPGLELCAKQIALGQMQSGSWGHGYFDGYSAGYGEMNNAGLACWMALELSRECGAKVDDRALNKARHYFGRFATPLCSQYGDHEWLFEGYATMNGKVAESAVAHRLHGNDEISAQFALKAARGMDRIEDGHTGCYFNILWTAIAASLAPAEEYRRALDQFGWYYALARTPRGGLFCQYGGDNLQRTGGEYSAVGPNMTTGGIGLALVAPRRHLRILGAPRGVFCRDLSGPLEKAREQHRVHDWAGCRATIESFLEEDGREPEERRMAAELKDKSRYVQASVEATIAQLDAMLGITRLRNLELRAYEIQQMLVPLQRLLGAGDPRVVALAAKLPDEQTPLYKRGKAYYEACNTLKSQANEVWWVYGQMAHAATRELVAQRLPRPWSTLADTEAGFRCFAVGDGAPLPKDWTATPFDDSGWSPTMPRGDTRGFAAVLMRTSFEGEASKIMSLRLSVTETLPGSTTIYLNGEEILHADSPLEGDVELLATATALPVRGKNVLCIRAAGKLKPPKVKVQARLLGEVERFAWTSPAGRDEKIRTLTAERCRPSPYYDPEKDQRTVDEVMADMERLPVFTPELYCALARFKTLVPPEQRTGYVAKLLKSSSWGGRLGGLSLIYEELKLPRFDRMRGAQRAAEEEAYNAKLDAWASCMDGVILLLNDPNVLVRNRAAEVLTGFGARAVKALPALAEHIRNTDEDWWVRQPAWSAIWRMDPDPETADQLMRVVLVDGASTMRGLGLGRTVRIEDEKERAAAMRKYKDQLVACVFDTPLAMWTRHSRKEVAYKLKELGRDEIRPYLDRFFGGLGHPRGDAMEGSMEILAWFGEEVADRLEALADGEDKTTSRNALLTLARMVEQGGVEGATSAGIMQRLNDATASDDIEIVRAARECLSKIATAQAGKEPTQEP